jgi:hypothetical protein
MRITLVVALAALPLLATAEGGQPGHGDVDWSRRVVRCTGSAAANLATATGVAAKARLDAERAARTIAVRNCLEVMKGVTVTSGQTVGAAMGDPGIRTSVEGVVRGFRQVDRRYYEDGGVDIDIEVPLDAVSDAVLPKAAAAPATGGPTSLVVDAAGLKVAPALSPRLLDEAGKEVYGAGSLGETARRAGGVAAYARGLEAARRDLAARLGDRPLIVKALRAQGADLVVSASDAATLAARPAFLAEGRVVILTD